MGTHKEEVMLFTQYITIILTIATLFFSILRYGFRPERTSLRIPILLLGIHVLIFYAYVFLNNIGAFPKDTFFELLEARRWSSILMMQSMFTHCSLEFYGYMRDKEWKSGKHRQ